MRVLRRGKFRREMLFLKKSRSLLALLLALMLILSVAPMMAYAADDDDPKVTNVNINNKPEKIRKGQTIALRAKVTPKKADDWIEWESDDESVVSIDADGRITGEDYGVAKITAYGGNNKKDSFYILVEGGSFKYKDYEDMLGDVERKSRSSSSSSTSESSTTTTKTPSSTVKTTESISTTKLKEGMNAALSSNKSATTFSNYDKISSESLVEAAKLVKSKKQALKLNFDTKDTKGSFLGRITLDPAKYEDTNEDINLGVEKEGNATGTITAKFDKYYKNIVAVVKCKQVGSYGSTARLCITGAGQYKAADLRLYTYSAKTNKFVEVKTPNFSVAGDYIYFDAASGGDYIITNGSIAKR